MVNQKVIFPGNALKLIFNDIFIFKGTVSTFWPSRCSKKKKTAYIFAKEH